jgi:hypothetical protein
MVDLTLDETSLPPNRQHQNGQNTSNNVFHPSRPPSLFVPPYSTNSASVFKTQQRNNHPLSTTFDQHQQNQPASSVFTPHHPFITRPHSTSGVFSTAKPSSTASASSSSPSYSVDSPYLYPPSLQEPTDSVTQLSAVEPLKQEQQTQTGRFDNDNTTTTTNSGPDIKAKTEVVDDDDDDDDVIIDEEMTNRNICLGMIKSDVVTKDPLCLIKDDLFEPVVMQFEGHRNNNYSK